MNQFYQKIETLNNIKLENTEFLILAIYLKIVIKGSKNHRDYQDILFLFESVNTDLYQNYNLGQLTKRYQEICYKYCTDELSAYDLNILKGELWDFIKEIFTPYGMSEDEAQFNLRRSNFAKELWHKIESTSLIDIDTYKTVIDRFYNERSSDYLRQTAESISDNLKYSDAESLLRLNTQFDEIGNFIQNLTKNQEKQESLNETFLRYQSELFKKDNTHFVFGLKQIDDLIRDQVPKENMVIIGGLPGHGKTAIGLNIFYNNIFRKRPDEHKGSFIFYSCELSQKQILERLLLIYMYHKTARNRCVRFSLTDIELAKKEFIEFISEYKDIYIIDSFRDIEDIHKDLYKKKKQKDIELIVIDYFQFLHTKDFKKESNDFTRINHVSNELLQIKKSIKSSLVVLAQLNTKKQKDYTVENLPSQEDIFYSSSIVQNADVVLNLLNLPAKDKQGNVISNMPSHMYFNICKNRSGLLGKGKFFYYGSTYSVS